MRLYSFTDRILILIDNPDLPKVFEELETILDSSNTSVEHLQNHPWGVFLSKLKKSMEPFRRKIKLRIW